MHGRGRGTAAWVRSLQLVRVGRRTAEDVARLQGKSAEYAEGVHKVRRVQRSPLSLVNVSLASLAAERARLGLACFGAGRTVRSVP
jgi:hypothetical protein